MEAEHKSYLAEKIILHSALLLVSFLINGIPVISVFMIMWLKYLFTWRACPLARESIDMIVMLPISSLCTDLFIVKTVVMYDRGIIKNRFLYFMKLFLSYYIFITILSILTTSFTTGNNTFNKLPFLTAFVLFYGTNYLVVLIFVIVFYLKNKEYFKIQNMLIE